MAEESSAPTSVGIEIRKQVFLIRKLEITWRQAFWTWEFGVAVIGGFGAAFLAYYLPSRLSSQTTFLESLDAAIMGAVIAAIAIVSAFMDESFIRKIHDIGKNPLRYVAPFMFTVLLAVVSLLTFFVNGVMPDAIPQWVRVFLGFFTVGFSIWTMMSLVANLWTFAEFIGLRSDAAEVPDRHTAS